MHKSIFEFWRVLEALTPNEASRVDAQASSPVVAVNVADSLAQLPWQDSEQPESARTGAKGFCVQAAVHEASAVHALVAHKLSQADEQLAASQKTRLFDLEFTADGYPVPATFRLSLAAWTAGYLVQPENTVPALLACASAVEDQGGAFAGFDDAQSELAEWIRNQLKMMHEQGTPATAQWMLALVRKVLKSVGLPESVLPSGVPCHVMTVRVRAALAEQPGQDCAMPLASFFVEDLARLERAATQGNIGKALAAFIEGWNHDSQERLDVRSPDAADALLASLHPSRVPQGRWPSAHALVFSQQLAVNSAWEKLRNGTGLLAVNGPPGTGKTTMLRDVVAAVVTERASVLARLGAGAFSAKQSTRLGDTWVPFYNLRPELSGFSIVVASSNNGAVENVTMELPGIGAVPETVGRSGQGYFREIASQVINREAWGLLAAPLGKSENRTAFLRSFWWGSRLPESDQVEQAPQGLRTHLKSILTKSGDTGASWSEALQAFERAQKREQEARAEMAQVADAPQTIAKLLTHRISLKTRATSLIDATKEQRQQILALSVHQARFAEQMAPIVHSLQELTSQKVLLLKQKPGVLQALITLGAARRQWDARYQRLRKQLSATLAQAQGARERLLQLQDDVAKQTQNYMNTVEKANLLIQRLSACDKKIALEQQRLANKAREMGKAWPRADVLGADREKSEPWASPRWLQARQNVFLAALDLHRAFIENNSAQVIANVGLASDWLNGKKLTPELAQLALDSLCLVVPVISTTFASMPRMCKALGRESIGWLLIDEAGQALPQQAAGSLWRARRAVVVGDPLQLEPVQTLPAGLERAVASQFNTPTRLWPSASSVQGLADQAAQMGTKVGDAPDAAVWVGCPLRLHRRCDEPMFSISNRVAYDDQMVQGKREETSPLPLSSWVDVRGGASDGHWVVDEGLAVVHLITTLEHEHGVAPEQIALISPFRDVARQLRSIGRSHGLDVGKLGTVHTAQGKEADVVILVLGGDPQSPGAKAWAAAKPNLLNVAVSRARKRLYVIGDRDAWKTHRNFDVLAHHLPLAVEKAGG